MNAHARPAPSGDRDAEEPRRRARPAGAGTTSGTVLLVEDDDGLGELITDYLGRNGLQVHWIRRGDRALQAARELAPDVLLLDVMLPGQDGFDICRELRSDGSTLPIVFLTARDEDVDRVVGLELGADAFLPKPVQPRVLLAHVRAILRRAGMRERAGTEPPVVLGPLEIDTSSRAVRLGGRAVDLTSSEFELLWLLARHAGKVLSRNDILAELRSLEYDGSDRSVDCRIYRLRRKLGDFAEGAERIKTVRNAGYLFSPFG